MIYYPSDVKEDPSHVRELFCYDLFRRAGINIFPHRGTDEWDNWGWTVPEKLELSKGSHTLVLKMESDADNMDLEINDFKIKGLCLIRL